MYDSGLWFGVVHVLRELQLVQVIRLGCWGGGGGGLPLAGFLTFMGNMTLRLLALLNPFCMYLIYVYVGVP